MSKAKEKSTRKKEVTSDATSAKGVKALLNNGISCEVTAGDGLYLRVSSKNKGSWLYRYSLEVEGKKKQTRISIGKAGANGLTLAEARELANTMAALVARGINPREHKQQEKIKAAKQQVTFQDVAAEYIEAKSSEWTNAKHAWQWTRTLEMFAYPVIGHLAPAEITTEHILEVLNPIWLTKAETASRVRNRIEIILNAAKAKKLRDGENVAAWRGHLELLLSKPKGKVRSMPALPYEQAPALYQELKQSNAMAAPALIFTLLTGVRSGEARGATWQEINLAKKLWVIPAERMKAKEPHRVPLSQPVLDLLDTLPRVASGLLFEGQKEGQAISNTTMTMFLRRADKAKYEQDGIGWKDANGETIVPHGFRSTLRDWIAERTNTPNHVAEQVLAHKISSAVEAAYRRGDLLEQRRLVMEKWASYLTQAPADTKVIKLHA